MKFVVDRNIPLVRKAFEEFGDVIEINTGEFTPKSVRDADVVIVRSETKVNSMLLEGSRIKFVATATIGTDHIDLNYLKSKGIGFSSAPGCNSNSVKEYVVAALLHLSTTKGFSLKGKTIGVVGVGNVGSKVVKAAEALGMIVLQNDPPLERQTGDNRFLSLNHLMEADIISLHVPLTGTGTDRTYHLFDRKRIAKLKPGMLFINTARGGVVDTGALKEAIRERRLSHSVIDVWENEPKIDCDLLSHVTLGTPHIAGHSLEGKINAVNIIREAFCKYYALQSTWNPLSHIDQSTVTQMIVQSKGNSLEEVFYSIVQQCYDIVFDDKQIRNMLSLPAEDRPHFFKELRTGYRIRREFTSVTVHLKHDIFSIRDIFPEIGFNNVISL